MIRKEFPNAAGHSGPAMGQIAVTLNGRTYRLRCGEGEEDRVVALATHVKAKVDQLFAEHGNVGDDRLLLMAALMVADELWDAKALLEASTAPASPAAPKPIDVRPPKKGAA